MGRYYMASWSSFKSDLLDVLDPSHYPGQPQPLLDDLKKAKADFTNGLPLDLRIPPSQSGNVSTGDSVHDWTINYFHMTPTIAALTISASSRAISRTLNHR